MYKTVSYELETALLTVVFGIEVSVDKSMCILFESTQQKVASDDESFRSEILIRPTLIDQLFII